MIDVLTPHLFDVDKRPESVSDGSLVTLHRLIQSLTVGHERDCCKTPILRHDEYEDMMNELIRYDDLRDEGSKRVKNFHLREARTVLRQSRGKMDLWELLRHAERSAR